MLKPTNDKVRYLDIINAFSSTVTKYSQIDNILNRLKAASVDINSEIGFAGNILLSLLDEFFHMMKCM